MKARLDLGIVPSVVVVVAVEVGLDIEVPELDAVEALVVVIAVLDHHLQILITILNLHRHLARLELWRQS